MKNRIITISLREIKNSFKRFISLLLISLLGVGVFVGIRSTPMDMMNSLDNYYDENNMYDIKVSSLTGISEEDIKSFESIKDVELVEGTKQKPVLCSYNGSNFVVNYHEITEKIACPKLVSGEYPKEKNEIMVEKTMLDVENIKIGDMVYIDDPMFSEKELKIVGTVSSVLYIGNNENKKSRGSTTIGTGNISYFVYGQPGNTLMPMDTQAFITVKGAKSLETNSEEYKCLIDNVKKRIPDGFIVSDRIDDETYDSFIKDSQSIKNLSKLFPTLFFVVAVFISLVSMSRMVEDDRMEIGTLISMGFSKASIVKKYMFFATAATIMGGIIGAVAGFLCIPNIIWNIYKILFDVPVFCYKYTPVNILTGICIVYICVGGATLITFFKNAKENPASLLRPKAPKKGKRVILEKIPFVWKRINFSMKVTIRNIFRYKSRVLMTIIGVGGCTALLICGFGLRDAIINIPNKQYREVLNYNETVFLGQKMDEESAKKLFEGEETKGIVTTCSGKYNVKNRGKRLDVTVIAPEDDFRKVFNLRDLSGNILELPKDDGVIISDKMSELLQINKGQKIVLTNSDGQSYNLKVKGICENYVGHIIFMSKEVYEKNMDNYGVNVVYLKTGESTIKEQEELSERLLKNPVILQVGIIDHTIENVENMLKSLNYVVMILIVLSAALSFVVMYNLSNINIIERKREIATLKVLGFYDGEVDSYIIRENVILTLIGIFAGLFLGHIFTNILVSTVEIESVRFIHKIEPSSYFISATLALVFTTIVNVITHFSLKKIDMIESLKSVE